MDPPAATADVFALLSQHHQPAAALEILAAKVTNKPLPLHPSTTTNARDARRQLRTKSPASRPQPLSAREKRQLRVHDLPRGHKFPRGSFDALEALWRGYAASLAAMGGGAPGLAGRLASGDLHGARVKVVRSRAVDRVGIEGVVVKETKGALAVVVSERVHGKEGLWGVVKTVPKEFAVFRVSVPPTEEERARGRSDMVFELQGNQLMFRAAERAGKKYKSKPMLDL